MPTVDYLDFDIYEDGNPRTITIIDKSLYKDTNPSYPMIDILLPGYEIPKTIAFLPKRLNILNSILLGVGCSTDDYSDLIDGVYWFTLKIKPYITTFKTISYLKCTSLTYRINNQLIKLDFSDEFIKNDSKLKEKILDSYFMLESAKFLVKGGDVDKGMELYRKAEKIINKIENQI